MNREMDIEEWEILPHEGFIDFNEDLEEGKKRSNKNFGRNNPKFVFNTNYFTCPNSPPRFVPNNQVVPVLIQLEPTTTTTTTTTTKTKDQTQQVLLDQQKHGTQSSSKDHLVEMAPTKVSLDLATTNIMEVPLVTVPQKVKADQDSVSQVFFKKMKENEFVDMKLDSPKFFSTTTIDTTIATNPLETTNGPISSCTSPRIKNLEKKETHLKEEEEEEEEVGGGLNLWKWSLTGVGAICSFGVAAAATICIVILSGHQKDKNLQTQNFRFQIYSDDKRINQMVHQATKLNEAIRGIPCSRAHITYGGYYDGI